MNIKINVVNFNFVSHFDNIKYHAPLDGIHSLDVQMFLFHFIKLKLHFILS